MDENWGEWRNELKSGLDTLAEKLGKLISHSELRSVPPYLEPITLSSTKQTLKRRGYTFAYLLVSQETLAALGSSLINLQMGTMLVQMQAGQGLVQIPLVAEECRYWVDGLKGSWDAVVYYTMQEAPAVTPLGSSTTSPMITELTGQLAPLTAIAPILVYTRPYSQFAASTTLYAELSNTFHRHARVRAITIVNDLDQPLSAAPVLFIWDAAIKTPSINYTLTNVAFPNTPSAQGQTILTGDGSSIVGAPYNSAFISLETGSTAPTSGSLDIYVTEVF